jgi:hypothetical protein
VLSDNPRHGWWTDVVETGHLGTGFAARDDALGDLVSLGSIELLPPAADASLGAGGGRDQRRSAPVSWRVSAKAPTICIIMRPAGVVVSMFSVIERKPAPALAIRSMICSTSFSDRDRRSSFQTTTVSPSRN